MVLALIRSCSLWLVDEVTGHSEDTATKGPRCEETQAQNPSSYEVWLTV